MIKKKTYDFSVNIWRWLNHVIGFSDLVDLWVIKIKKNPDPLCTYYVEIT